jgi:hypothetical protein
VSPNKRRIIKYSVELFVYIDVSVIPFLVLEWLACWRYGSVTLGVVTFSCLLLRLWLMEFHCHQFVVIHVQLWILFVSCWVTYGPRPFTCAGYVVWLLTMFPHFPCTHYATLMLQQELIRRSQREDSQINTCRSPSEKAIGFLGAVQIPVRWISFIDA